MNIRLSALCIMIASTAVCQNKLETNQELFENKNIVVLGGTGYLGRTIVAEVLKYNPKRVVIFSRDEVKHFNMSKIFGNNPKINCILGDIRDVDSLIRVTRDADIVFHVAALKRMDGLETNVQEAVKTNILGSLNVFNACVANNVKKVLFISTDKACLPINTYGACKFVSEKIFTNYEKLRFNTKFIAVRFGNILESTGSVIPIFVDKINSGADITLTDDRMTRFIINKDDAAKLLFDALRYGVGGEIFIRHLPSMKIVDLIEVLKKGFHATNKVKVIGLRPGEKLHEVLIDAAEVARSYEFEGYFVIRPSAYDIIDEKEEEPLYAKFGKKVDNTLIRQYSSDMAVVSKERLEKILIESGVFA